MRPKPRPSAVHASKHSGFHREPLHRCGASLRTGVDLPAMLWASAISTAPRLDAAVADALDQLERQLDSQHPDLVIAFVTSAFGAEQASLRRLVQARWSDGRALLRLPGAGPGVLRLRLAAPHPDAQPTRAEVCVAGRCQVLSVGPTWRIYELPLTTTLAGEQQIEISSDTFDAPEGRRLGLLIDWADVQAN